MFQDPTVTLTRVSDAAELVIRGNAEFSRDQNANLMVTWTDPLVRDPGRRLTRADLAGWVSEHVEQQRNRAGAYLAITDPTGVLLHVRWTEIDPWAGEPLAEQSLYAVASVASSNHQVDRDTLSLVLYRADYRFGRGSGLLEVRPEP